MHLSIPVKDFIDPPKGSRPWNAVNRAIDLQPSVVLIGQFQGERWYRVRCKGRDRRCVILWYSQISQQEVGRCDCEASYVPVSGPTHCYHLAAALIYEASQPPRKLASMGRKGGSNGRRPIQREENPAPVDDRVATAS